MKVFKEKPNIISKNALWVCIHKEYMYTSDTLFRLLLTVIIEWESDKHLVG